eukprot:Pgem_evm1s6714
MKYYDIFSLQVKFPSLPKDGLPKIYDFYAIVLKKRGFYCQNKMHSSSRRS